MSTPLLNRHAEVRQGAYLPHWTTQGAIYHVVFRLGDSLPAWVVARFRAEREALLIANLRNNVSPAELEARISALFSERIESALDCGLGACWLARDNLATRTAQALQHFDGTRYKLHAWCVMPNHVHVVVQPEASHGLAGILKSWKGFTAHEANRELCRAGQFWQPESYDHLIRSEAELARTISYVQANPAKAGMTNWSWVWPAVT